MRKIYLLVFAAFNFQYCFPTVHVNMLSTPAVLVGAAQPLVPHSYSVDFDGNGQTDVQFLVLDSTASVGGLNGNQVDCTQGSDLPVAYDCGAKCSFYLQKGSGSLYDRNNVNPTNFDGQGPHYLFVYFYNGGPNFKTAWVKIAAAGVTDSLIIYGWAYSDDYYDTIKLGQGECFTTALEDVLPLNVTVSLQSGSLHIEYTEQFEAQLLDISGRAILKPEEGTNVTMNVASLPKGIYILYLCDEKQRILSKKIVL